MFVLAAAALAAPTYESFARDPRDTLLADRRTPGGFRIVALSQLAEACAADADVGCIERVTRAALHPSIRSTDPSDRLGEHGLYLSHLGVILGKCAEIGGDCDAALHARVAAHLAERSVSEGVIASFPGDARRYPADQTVTLYALALHDRTRGTTLLGPALEAFHAKVDPSAENVWGLPVSELTGAEPWSDLPRGCALSWSVQYLAQVEPDHAWALWKRYRTHFYVVVGPVGGFREWPLGQDRPADADSGPIVLGVGAAATAFGLAASRAVGDPVRTGQLEGAEWIGRRQGHAVADSALAVAITAASERRVPPEH